MHPTVAFEEILDHVLLELGIPVQGGGRDALLQRLAEFLREHAYAGGNTVVFFDEAQALQDATLDALPALLDLAGAGGRPALQIVLAGQPELETRLASRAHAKLRARVAVTARLGPLPPDEVASYVRARLAHAQAQDLELFTPEALARVAALSGGIPRIINVLCEAALVAAFADGQRPIGRPTIETVWADYAPLHRPEGTPMPRPPTEPIDLEPAGEPGPQPGARRRRIALAAAGVAAASALALLAIRPSRSPPPPAPVPAEPPATAPTVPPPVASPEPTTPEPTPGPPEAPPDAPPSALEALALVDRFWRAYEARDRDGVRALFAPEAVPTGDVLERRSAGRRRAGHAGSPGRGQAGRGSRDGAGAVPADHPRPARATGAAPGRGDVADRPARRRAPHRGARGGDRPGAAALADMERPVVNTRVVHGSVSVPRACKRVGTTDAAGRFDDESL